MANMDVDGTPGAGFRIRNGKGGLIEDCVAVGCGIGFDIDNAEGLTMRRNSAYGCGPSGPAPEPKKPSMVQRFKEAAKDEGPKVALSVLAEAARRCIDRW